MNEKLLNRIISVAYNDANLLEKYRIYRLALKDPKIKSVLDEYKKVANQSHKIAPDYCPDKLIDNAAQMTKVKANPEKSLFFDLYTFIFNRPVISAAILSLFILALVSTFIFERHEIHNQYTRQEIEKADKQVKHSLALIANVFKETTTTVEEDILTERVSKPIVESFNLVNEYFKGDNKNEKLN